MWPVEPERAQVVRRVPDLLAERNAWRGALISATLNALGSPLDLVIGRGVRGMPWVPTVAAALLGAAIAGWLLVHRRERPTVRVSSALFLLNNLAVVAALVATARSFGSAGILPFQANKLGVFAVALLAPELRVGIVCIVLFTGTALAQLWSLSDAGSSGVGPLSRDALPKTAQVTEPWAMLAFGVFAVALLVHRARRRLTERSFFEAEARASTALRLAELGGQIRDLSNTPLQTIMLEAELIRQEAPTVDFRLARIERAVARLVELNRSLPPADGAPRGARVTLAAETPAGRAPETRPR